MKGTQKTVLLLDRVVNLDAVSVIRKWSDLVTTLDGQRKLTIFLFVIITRSHRNLKKGPNTRKAIQLMPVSVSGYRRIQTKK